VRLNEPSAPELVYTAYARELGDTPILYEGMSLADIAHVVALIESDIIPSEAGGELLHALLAAHPKPPLDFAQDPATGDLYSNREAFLSMVTPHAGYLSAGRPRREAITVAFRVAVRSGLLKLAMSLVKYASAASDLAEAHQTTLFPDYTYLQTAQPTTFGHYLLTFVYPVLRDLERLQTAFARTNASPAGSGSVNGTRLPLDRVRLAQLLGFDTYIPHTRDAMWQADGPIEVASLLATTMINFNRLSEDLQIFATQEFGLVELADRHSRTSKIMPQKKNPYSLTYVRGVAGEMVGKVASMTAISKTPSGQPDNRIFAHGVVPRALDQVIGVAQLLTGVLGGLTINVERAAERAAAGFSGATDLAESIMLESGVDYKTAHDIVGRLVRDTQDDGLDPADVTPELMSEALDRVAEEVIGRRLELPAELLVELQDPEAIVAARKGPGGASQSSMDVMLAEIRGILDRKREWYRDRLDHLAASKAKLQSVAESMATTGEDKQESEESSGTSGDEKEKTMKDLLSEFPDRNWRRNRWR
jgi:argininosuccinate lyase